jgi:P27 family predicted phage terminase small subunit
MPPKKQLSAQKGDLTEEVQKKKQLEEEAVFVGNDQLENPPEWLVSKRAESEWIRLVNEFNKKSMISNLDFNNLGAYCNAFSRYADIVEDLRSESVLIVGQANPLIALELKYSDEMRKYASLLGLSVESRLKLGAGLVSDKENEVEDSFGDI